MTSSAPQDYAQKQSAYHAQVLAQLFPVTTTFKPNSTVNLESPTSLSPSSFHQGSGHPNPMGFPKTMSTSSTSTIELQSPTMGPANIFDRYGVSEPKSWAPFGESYHHSDENKPDPILGQLPDNLVLPESIMDLSYYTFPVSNRSLPDMPDLTVQLQQLSSDQTLAISPDLQPDLFGTLGGPFKSPETSTPNLSAPTAINPDWLKTEPANPFDDESDHAEGCVRPLFIDRLSKMLLTSADVQHDYPDSPLRSLSSTDPSPEPVRPNLKRMRSQSHGAFSNPKAGGLSKQRKMTQSAGMTIDTKITDLEFEELKELEQGGPSKRRDRRRLQNRLAQRAFRARSKITNRVAAQEMSQLQELTEIQSKQLKKLSELVDRLQRENTLLKTGKWAEMQRQTTNGRAVGQG